VGNYPSLSEADYAVMEILWQKGKAKSSDIYKALFEAYGWSRQTVGTYLKRLVEKGLVTTQEKNKRDYIYFPAVTKEVYGADITGDYLSRYFGSLSHMVAGLMQNEHFSNQEIEELEALIREYKEKK